MYLCSPFTHSLCSENSPARRASASFWHWQECVIHCRSWDIQSFRYVKSYGAAILLFLQFYDSVPWGHIIHFIMHINNRPRESTGSSWLSCRYWLRHCVIFPWSREVYGPDRLVTLPWSHRGFRSSAERRSWKGHGNPRKVCCDNVQQVGSVALLIRHSHCLNLHMHDPTFSSVCVQVCLFRECWWVSYGTFYETGSPAGVHPSNKRCTSPTCPARITAGPSVAAVPRTGTRSTWSFGMGLEKVRNCVVTCMAHKTGGVWSMCFFS